MYAREYAILIVILGLVMHAWGVYDKHRLETSTGVSRLWWTDLLYWLCWATLAAIVLRLLARRA